MHQRIKNKTRKLYSIKNQAIKYQQEKYYIEVMTLQEKHDIDKTYMDLKSKMTQTQLICNKENSKTQIKKKQNS